MTGSGIRRIGLTGLMLFMASAVRAEMREWTFRSGATIQGEYVTVAFDRIVLRDADGKRITFAFSEVSAEDVRYIELTDPPPLKIDLLKSEDQVFVKPSPFVNNSPANVMRYRFGARVKQTDFRDYHHDLVVEIYAMSRQVYDPDKYRLVLKWQSMPFRVSPENGRRVEIHSPREVELSDFLLSKKYPRGQELAETVITVRDERGIVIACNATKNWLSNNLEKLEALPEGAWFDKSCRRVHPTSPKAVWFN
jgi:hypothetical protein